MFLPPLRPTLAFVTLGLLTSTGLQAQQAPPPDAAPVDAAKMLKSLKELHEQESSGVKALKLAAYQTVAAAASAADGGVSAWEDAIRGTQMDGAGKEAATFRNWKETDGELYKEREVQSAIHLSLEWLALTLQRSSGTEVKDMLPAIVNYTKELLNDQAMVDALDETIKRDKELPPGTKARNPTNPKARDESPERIDRSIKELHDRILSRELSGNVVAKALKMEGYLDIAGWEQTPGDFDGIYNKIVQPELRGQLSQRVFDYWDAKLQTGADRASRSKLTYEIDEFNTIRRPELLWGRAEEYAYLGQTNRAATEMFNLIKTYPTHPDAEGWIIELKKFLGAPPDPVTPAAPAGAPASAAGVPGK